MSRRRLAGPGVWGVLAVLGITGLLTAPAAQAHDELVSARPAAGSTVVAPTRVVLTFAEPVLDLGGRGNRVVVQGPSGDATSGAPVVEGPTLTQVLRPGLAQGRYVVTWRAASKDGHPVSGTFAFTVAAGPTAGPTSAPATAAPTPAARTPAASRTPAPAAATPAGAANRFAAGVAGLAALALVSGLVVARRRRR